MDQPAQATLRYLVIWLLLHLQHYSEHIILIIEILVPELVNLVPEPYLRETAICDHAS